MKALDLLKNKPIGELLTIKGVFTFDLTPRPDDIRWVPEYGGGSIWDVGCYPLSFARAVLPGRAAFSSSWRHSLQAPSSMSENSRSLLSK